MVSSFHFPLLWNVKARFVEILTHTFNLTKSAVNLLTEL